MRLAEFNAASVEKADSAGAAAVVTGRPYAAVGDLVAAGRRAAAGVTAEEIDAALAHQLRRRPRTDPATEDAVVAQQLGEIAVLRLTGAVTT